MTVDKWPIAIRAAFALALVGSLAVVQACGTGGAEPPPGPTSAEGGIEPPAAPPPPGAGPTSAPAAGLTVFFMLDPRVTTSSYMGERWVAPATFTIVLEGESAVLAARARVVSAQGTVDASATWTAGDPDMLEVAPAEAHEVALTVRRAGRSSLTVASAEGSRALVVTATRDEGSWRVDVTQ